MRPGVGGVSNGQSRIFKPGRNISGTRLGERKCPDPCLRDHLSGNEANPDTEMDEKGFFFSDDSERAICQVRLEVCVYGRGRYIRRSGSDRRMSAWTQKVDPGNDLVVNG